MAGSSSSIPASNQSGDLRSLLPKVSTADLYVASRMWFHLSSAQLVGQSLRASWMVSAKRLRSSGMEVMAVLMRGRPFCFER